MGNYLKILAATEVYREHDENSSILGTLEKDEIVSFTREKRRNGKNWMEIYYQDDQLAYIPKVRDTFFKCRLVKLSDELAEGHEVLFKSKEIDSPYKLFYPVGLSESGEPKAQTTFRTVEKREESKIITVDVEYNSNLAELKPIQFKKEDEFYITEETYGKNFIFIEVNDFQDRKGFILKKTNHSSREDLWILPVSIIVMAAVVIGIILTILQSGWLVVSGLMIIPAVIVAVVAIFAIQIVLSILKGVFNLIYKRF